MEYEKTVAHVAGPNPRDLWAKLVAPRHFRVLNVLFEDGHVETRVPDDIDPRIRSIHNELWWPDG